MYAVMQLIRNITLRDLKTEKDISVNVDYENEEEGLIGLIPVYETMEQAEKIHGTKFNIYKIEK